MDTAFVQSRISIVVLWACHWAGAQIIEESVHTKWARYLITSL